MSKIPVLQRMNEALGTVGAWIDHVRQMTTIVHAVRFGEGPSLACVSEQFRLADVACLNARPRQFDTNGFPILRVRR